MSVAKIKSQNNDFTINLVFEERPSLYVTNALKSATKISGEFKITKIKYLLTENLNYSTFK
jgi:hypothetical protein